MAKSVVVEQSRAIPVQSEDAFGGTLAAALPVICSHWYGLIPPIKEVRDQTGAWDSVGQARVITMVGGGRVREELTSVDPPRSFGYTLTDIKGPLAPLVALVEGKWSFAPADTGTTVTWQWTIHPRSALAAPVLPVFARMWRGYARGVLEKLSALLVGRAALPASSTVGVMCRLFGLHSGTDAVTATFWLLNASDSLAEQSRRNPDGTGLGVFDEHHQPRLHKQPIAAWQDADFATEAHELTGTTFVAHVRYATTGSLDIRNTHPFLQDGRIFAHNGVVEGLDVLDERLREVGADDLVLGQTDSERVFALITASIRARDGNESAGLIDALRWLAANVPIYAVNVLLSTATDVWALRYPESHELYILDRRGDGAPEFHLRSKRIRAHSTHLRERSSVVFATEPMDDNPRWRLLDAGELVHVDAALRVNRSLVLPDPPRHPILREDLSEPVLHAQHTSA